jgi:spore maturation protein CgeB
MFIVSKTALWYPDDPRYFNSLVKYIAPSYDHVFTASEKAIDMYREIGCEKIHFLPFACEPSVHKKMNTSYGKSPRDNLDVVFVGTYYPRRGRLIKALEKAGIKVKVYGPYWRYFMRSENVRDGIYGPEMVKVFNSSKIVLNIHIESDLRYKVNIRTFETTGCGSFLLTDYAYGMKKLFEVDKEVVIYNDADELIKLTKHYLKDEGERMAISEKGQKKAYDKHTYRLRIINLLTLI